ncbi:MAG: phosphonate C-P lyase system protein PhnG [Spirochaetaceae bacterium]|nr:MAG: phosphonate C-P lyase system protein PhnG [Spirochaetaceae bacterium]
MTRKQRTRILVESGEGLARQLVEMVDSEELKVISLTKPEEGLVMIQCRDGALKTRFYLGELLVTEAKVQINGHIGIGYVRGRHHAWAKDLAIIDALFNQNHQITLEWKKSLERAEITLAKQEKVRSQKILATKVDFQTMAE